MKTWRAWFAALVLTFSATGCPPNFHEVDPGKLYRSAQLTGPELEHAIQKLGIRSVINLRGPNPGKDWYDGEVQVTRAHGVRQFDIPMRADRIPHRKRLLELLDALESAERPILVHCRAGADRTGEASAIYQMEYMGKTREEALEMLTLKYDHLALVTPAKRYFIGLYQGREWARGFYDPCSADYLYYDKSSCETGRLNDDEPDLPELSAPWAASF